MLSNHPSVLGSGGGTAYDIIGGTGLFADGTAAAPSISFASDSDTGIYRYATNSIGFATGGANRFFMSGSQFGGVTGQNIDMPAAGSIALTASGTNQNITLTPSGTGTVSVGAIIAGAAFPNSQLDVNSTGVTLQASSVIDFKTGAGAQAARFQSNARFCLGTTTDSANGVLQLAASTAITGGIGFGTDTSLFRVGVGILQVTSTGATAKINFINSAVGASGASLTFGSTTLTLQNTEAGSIVFSTNGATALTLDASQNATFANSVTLTAGNLTSANLTGYAIKDSVGTSRYAIRSFTGNVLQIGETGGWTDTTVYANGALALTLGASQNALFAGRARTADGTLASPGHSFGNDTASGMYRAGTNTIGFSSGGVLSLTLGGFGEVVCGASGLGTTTTDGFFYLRAMAGAPTGVPTAFTGRVAATYDTTNNKLYIYNGAWKSIVLV